MPKGVYVIDFDDVLVNFSKEMYKNIRENWRLYKRYFWDPGELTNEEIQNRHFYTANEWLIHKKYKNLTSEEYSALSLEIWELFLKTFFSKPDIYDDATLTQFAKKTLLNTMFIDSPLVEKVYILSRSLTPEQTESKERFINKYFNNPKISFINVEGRKSKGDILKENKIDFNVFVDDELSNIRDVAEKFHDSLDRKEFIIPKFGYNQNMPKDLRLLIEGNGGIITYYEPFTI